MFQQHHQRMVKAASVAALVAAPITGTALSSHVNWHGENTSQQHRNSISAAS
jgi:hypothetical protein